jgi:hypothetical protein
LSIYICTNFIQELKIYEIASSVTDAIAKSALTSRQSPWDATSSLDRPGDILNQLQRILSSCRGGNKTLVSMLCTKIAEVQNGQMLLIEPNSRIIEQEDTEEQWHDSVDSNGMAFTMSMELGNVNGPSVFDDQQEETPMASFVNTQDRDSSTPPALPGNQLHQQLPQIPRLLSQQQQSSFLPFSSWPFQEPPDLLPDSANTFERPRDLYRQAQQNYAINASFGISGMGNGEGIERFMSTGELWNNALGLNIEGLGSGPEPVEQWN